METLIGQVNLHDLRGEVRSCFGLSAVHDGKTERPGVNVRQCLHAQESCGRRKRCPFASMTSFDTCPCPGLRLGRSWGVLPLPPPSPPAGYMHLWPPAIAALLPQTRLSKSMPLLPGYLCHDVKPRVRWKGSPLGYPARGTPPVGSLPAPLFSSPYHRLARNMEDVQCGHVRSGHLCWVSCFGIGGNDRIPTQCHPVLFLIECSYDT